MKGNIFQEVTQKIIEALRQGVGPWMRPWDPARSDGVHRNAVSGRPYRGINVLLLNLRSMEKGFGSSLWLTFRDAKRLGGHIRKGEKGIRIVFWKFKEVPELDPEGQPLLNEQESPVVKTLVFGCSYVVFNSEQCEDLNLKRWEEERDLDPMDQVTGAERILGLADIRFGGSRAAYDRWLDLIVLPSRKAFKTQEDFYATGLHEMTHWTGHESRLNREFGKRFGDRAYAFEELVAEIGSAFLGAHVGLPIERLQHPEYIGDWIEVLENDRTYKAVFTAARKAQEACDFLLEAAGLSERRDLKKAA